MRGKGGQKIWEKKGCKNKYADIVIYSPDKLDCNESLLDTRTYPKGIDYVLVNGVITAQEEIYTGEKAGRILRG